MIDGHVRFTLQVTSCRSQVSSFRFQVAGYRFQVAGYKLQVSSQSVRLYVFFPITTAPTIALKKSTLLISNGNI